MLNNGTYNCVGLGLLCTRHFASSEIGQELALLTDGRHGFPQLHLREYQCYTSSRSQALLFMGFPVHCSQVFQLLYAIFSF